MRNLTKKIRNLHKVIWQSETAEGRPWAGASWCRLRALSMHHAESNIYSTNKGYRSSIFSAERLKKALLEVPCSRCHFPTAIGPPLVWAPCSFDVQAWPSCPVPSADPATVPCWFQHPAHRLPLHPRSSWSGWSPYPYGRPTDDISSHFPDVFSSIDHLTSLQPPRLTASLWTFGGPLLCNTLLTCHPSSRLSLVPSALARPYTDWATWLVLHTVWDLSSDSHSSQGQLLGGEGWGGSQWSWRRKENQKALRSSLMLRSRGLGDLAEFQVGKRGACVSDECTSSTGERPTAPAPALGLSLCLKPPLWLCPPA